MLDCPRLYLKSREMAGNLFNKNRVNLCMSVVDDLKNTLGGSDSSSSRSNSHSRSRSSGLDDGGFDSDLDSDFGSPNDGTNSLDTGNNPGRQPRGQSQNGQQDNFNRHGNDQLVNQGRNQGGQDRLDQQSQRADSRPNTQAGRPQQGSSRPQVSSQTQKKMENAGFRSDNQNHGQRGRQEPVADQRNNFEELKSQNEQIIELLKRINRNLEQLGR